MKRSKKVVNVLFALSILICMESCKNQYCPDAISGATPYSQTDKKIILPPKSNTYTTIGLMNGLKGFVVKYDDNLYRGGKLISEKGIKSLKSLGVRTIVSVTPTDAEREIAKKHGFLLIEIPFTKDLGLSKDDIQRFIAIFKNNSMPIYMHCNGGSHRGGILGLTYRIHKNNWSMDKALLEYGYLGGDLKDDQIMIQSIKNSIK